MGIATLDWLVLGMTIAFIVGYGIWKTKTSSDSVESYIRGNSNWWTIGLSVMATQASAITFISTPGQAYHDGMGFVQFYFGLPLAMVIICMVFIPIYHKLKVYTAYEYLEGRFDRKTRLLAAILFLIQRGLGAGITIYAPAIILSTILGWDLNSLIFIIGVLVILYTVSGGTNAVSVTQKQQMFVIMGGMFIAFFSILNMLPEGVGFTESLSLASKAGKMEILNFDLDMGNRYTFWSGITGGMFLALAYFGTDQSQVQRYLAGDSIQASRMGLVFNGILKVPMQFFILLTGVMVYVFFLYNKAPVFFNQAALNQVEIRGGFEGLSEYQKVYDGLVSERIEYLTNTNEVDPTVLQGYLDQEKVVRSNVKELITSVDPTLETNDKDYVFISFILKYLPSGLIGLLLAVIFSAAMSSTASELNALASTTTIDLYKTNVKKDASDAHYIKSTKWFTVMWGGIAILFASIGSLFENLIQFVNIIGSLFYGTILGIFLVGFFFEKIKGRAVFLAAVITEIMVIWVYLNIDISYLWLNVIGCLGVILYGFVLQLILKERN
jgi:Na+/proline symporter